MPTQKPKQRFEYRKLQVFEQRRLKIGITQQEMARHFGRTDSETVRYWELGYRAPKQKNYRQQFLSYLLDKLDYRNEIVGFRRLWSEVIVGVWKWDELTTEELDQFDLAISDVFFVPSKQSGPALVGRDSLIDTVKRELKNGRSIVLTGLAGVGKSALVLSVVHEEEIMEWFKQGVLWAGFGPNPDVVTKLQMWANALNCEVERPSVATYIETIRNTVGKRRLLFVFDDIWNKDLGEQLVNICGPNCAYIMSTRDRSIAQHVVLHGTYMQEVKELTDDFGYQLLDTLAHNACEAAPDIAKTLVKAVGGLPLSLVLLGGYLADTRHHVFHTLCIKALNHLQDTSNRLALEKSRLGLADNGQISLRATIELSLNNLSHSAKETFYALGAFAPKPDWFTLAAAKAVTKAGEPQLAELITRHLVEINAEEQLVLHQSVADVASLYVRESVRENHRNYYLGVVNRDQRDWNLITSIYGQIKFAWSIMPEKQICLDYIEALEMYQKRHGLWEDRLVWSHYGLTVAKAKQWSDQIAWLSDKLGCIYFEMDEYQQSFEYHNRALKEYIKLNDRVGIGSAINNIGSVYWKEGKLQQALSCHKRALPFRRKSGDLMALAITLNNIGTDYEKIGDWQEAVKYYEQSLVIRRNVGTEEEVATVLNNMGTTYRKLQDFPKARYYLTSALEIRQREGTLASQARTLSNLGLTIKNEGNLRDALTYYKRAMSICEKINDRTVLSGLLNNIGKTYAEWENSQQALIYFNRALVIQEQIGNLFDQAVTLRNIGQLYGRLGDHTQAQDYVKRAMALANQVNSSYLLDRCQEVLNEISDKASTE